MDLGVRGSVDMRMVMIALQHTVVFTLRLPFFRSKAVWVCLFSAVRDAMFVTAQIGQKKNTPKPKIIAPTAVAPLIPFLGCLLCPLSFLLRLSLTFMTFRPCFSAVFECISSAGPVCSSLSSLVHFLTFVKIPQLLFLFAPSYAYIGLWRCVVFL